MPTLREKLAGFLRQTAPSEPKTESNNNNTGASNAPSAPQETFIHKYLNGQIKKTQPEIIFGKCCYDLPMKKLARLSKTVLAAHTGPAGGLLNVHKKQKAFEYLDLDVDFIDEDYEGSSENINKLNIEETNGNEKEKTIKDESKNTGTKLSTFNGPTNTIIENNNEIAGIKNWDRPDARAFGIATSLYEKHPITKANAGEPVADAFAICLRENSAILALADGVNWGEKSCLAARCAVHGCIDYLNNALYREGGRLETTMDLFVCLLRSFHAAHTLILQEDGYLTTLCAAIARTHNELVRIA